MKNVMIAGGTGMIGRACTRLLKEREGYKVFAPKRAELDLSDRYLLLAFMKEKEDNDSYFCCRPCRWHHCQPRFPSLISR